MRINKEQFAGMKCRKNRNEISGYRDSSYGEIEFTFYLHLNLFCLAGKQKQSEAVLLQVRVDGVIINHFHLLIRPGAHID